MQDLVPPFSKWGTVTDGGHFFTFDGRHLTLSGTCTYILAQDIQDGNFSVVANFNNGNLISITITEPKESITLKNNGNVSENEIFLSRFHRSKRDNFEKRRITYWQGEIKERNSKLNTCFFQILVNNKPADYPASTNNLHAYLVPPFGNVKSDYGVRLACTNKAPMICVVQVSGFYLGKLRGIFGDANNEPYDDFTLPSGKVCVSRIARFLKGFPLRYSRK